jgi:hypothetical protein
MTWLIGRSCRRYNTFPAANFTFFHSIISINNHII